MASTSRVRPRPRSLHLGSARFILSVVAIVKSGLHMAADAYTLPFAGIPRAEQPAPESHSAWGSLRHAGAPQQHHTCPSGRGALTSRSRPSVGGRGNRRRSSGGRRTSLDAMGTAIAPPPSPPAPTAAAAVGGAVFLEEKLSRQERVALTRGVNSMTKLGLETRPTTTSMTVPEEITLVEEVKVLASFLKTRQRLVGELGRQPSREEWAASVGISTQELSMQMAVSQRAQERIVESNVGLIMLMARRHHPMALYKGALARDVVQEGSLALLRAAETFDPDMGCRFSTYAGWWVRDRVQRCVVEHEIIRLPQHVHNFRRTIGKTEAVLLKELGRRPTYEETAERMEVDVARVIRYANCPETFSLDDAPAASMVGSGAGGSRSSTGRGSAQATGKNSGAGYRHEKVACSMISPEQEAEVLLFRTKLDKLLSVLSPDERLIMSLRYGLGGTSPTPLSDVAERAGSTKHRVRMMETRALNKLRRRRTGRNRLGRGGRGHTGGRSDLGEG